MPERGPHAGPAPRPSPRVSTRRLRLVQLAFCALLAFTWARGRAPAPAADPDRLGLAGVRFQEVGAQLGVRFRHAPPALDPVLDPIAPQLAGVGAAVSVCDADGDGSPDLYATSSAPGRDNALFRNLGDGRYEEVGQRAGVVAVNRSGELASMGSLWADLDGNGLDDGFVYGWGRPRLFGNRGGLRFEDATAGSGLERRVNSNAAALLDRDRDGHLDLYVATYFADEHDLERLDTTRILTDSFEFADNGGPNRLYQGRGDGTFAELPAAAGADSTRWTYAVAAADYDRDGWIDLYLANDYGPEEVFLNREGRAFELARRVGLDGESKSGMAVALGDALGKALPSVFVTNISSSRYLFQGNNLRVAFGGEDLYFLQFAERAVADCGWAWGAQFGDLDDDGLEDLVVANGFVSASREQDYWYQMSKLGAATGGLVRDAANWPAMEGRSLSGYERTRALFNLGGGRFIEAGKAVGIDDTHDGRAVALADLEGDGDLDILLATQGGPLLVYRNETRNFNHWVALDLTASGSNTAAIGAEVELRFGDQRRLHTVTAGTGFSSQNQRRAHFGLGAYEGSVSATVRWPSGAAAELEGLAIDRVHPVSELR